jgi:hypothetical protein
MNWNGFQSQDNHQLELFKDFFEGSKLDFSQSKDFNLEIGGYLIFEK